MGPVRGTSTPTTMPMPPITAQRNAKAAPRQKRVTALIAFEDRFGDGPSKHPPRREPRGGGAAPIESTVGFNLKEDSIPHTGSSPTWTRSGPTASRAPTSSRKTCGRTSTIGCTRPPARYSPEKLSKTWYKGLAKHVPSAHLGGGGPRLAKQVYLNDLIYEKPDSIGKQVDKPSATGQFKFGGVPSEKRLATQPQNTLEYTKKVLEVAHKHKNTKGCGLSAKELEVLKTDRKNDTENGAYTSTEYQPKSDFNRYSQGSGMKQSKSFAFSGSLGTTRSFQSRPGSSQVYERAMAIGAKNPPPPHGGKMGSAFRAQPKVAPGPGDYKTGHYDGADCGFNGTGKLAISKSVPAISIPSYLTLEKKMGGSDKNTPTPSTYFQTEVYTPGK